MRKIELLKSHRSELGKILVNKGLKPLDFQWNEIKSSYLKDTRIQSLVYKHSKYFFAFDRHKNSSSSSERWACRYSPDQDISEAAAVTESWNNATVVFAKWATIVKRELEAEDPWVEAEEEFARDWTTSNEKFNTVELGKLDTRLEEVKQYLLEQSDKSDQTIKSIESGIADLKKSARHFGKKDWATMFVGWFFMSCTEWTINQVHWQQVVTILLKSTKTFLLQG